MHKDNVAASSLMCLVLAVTCGQSASLFPAQDPPEYSDWSAPINLGPPNTVLAEIAPFVSSEGLSLYFVRGAGAGGFGGMDIWVAQRASTSDAWGPPQNVGSTINTPFNDFGPSLSLDGHRLYFASNRPGFGRIDLYVSRRHNKRDDFGWRQAANLGGGVNTDANELQAAHFEDDRTGLTTLYFASNRLGGHGGDDIYASRLLPDEAFSTPVLVEELASPSADIQPAIRRDGLEMLFASNRPGTHGGLDLWVSTRASTSDPWSLPANLGAVINSGVDDARPALSFDATELYFQSSGRPDGVGSQDFYRSIRSRLKQPD